MIEDLDDLGEVGQRARQPVDLVDDHDIDPAFADVAQQPLQRGSLHRAAGDAAIVILVGNKSPSERCLRSDVSGAGLTLRVERVEVLIEPLLGRLAGVDGAMQTQRVTILAHRPKNLGPDQ